MPYMDYSKEQLKNKEFWSPYENIRAVRVINSPRRIAQSNAWHEYFMWEHKDSQLFEFPPKDVIDSLAEFHPRFFSSWKPELNRISDDYPRGLMHCALIYSRCPIVTGHYKDQLARMQVECEILISNWEMELMNVELNDSMAVNCMSGRRPDPKWADHYSELSEEARKKSEELVHRISKRFGIVNAIRKELLKK